MSANVTSLDEMESAEAGGGCALSEAEAFAEPVGAETAGTYGHMHSDMTVDLAPGEGLCVLCDQTFEDISML